MWTTGTDTQNKEGLMCQWLWCKQCQLIVERKMTLVLSSRDRDFKGMTYFNTFSSVGYRLWTLLTLLKYSCIYWTKSLFIYLFDRSIRAALPNGASWVGVGKCHWWRWLFIYYIKWIMSNTIIICQYFSVTANVLWLKFKTDTWQISETFICITS